MLIKPGFIVRILIIIFIYASNFFFSCNSRSYKLPEVDEKLGNAVVKTDDNRLVVGTGKIERQWTLTENGLITTNLKDLVRGREWMSLSDEHVCDWDIAGLTDGPVKVISINATKSDDEGFTSDHLEVVLAMEYPECHVSTEYVIWLYPDAEGIRTFLRFKGLEGFQASDPISKKSARIDFFSMDMADFRRRAVSYSKHSIARANRYEQHPMMSELVKSGPVKEPEIHPFAALMAFEDDRGCLAVVKEAPVIDTPVRGTNLEREDSYAYRTGKFVCDTPGLTVTGAGIAAHDVLKDRYRRGWATWTVVSGPDNIELQRAVKMFDRVRYPLKSLNDVTIGANNWGSTDNPQDGWKSSVESSILKEIDAAAEMGIEVVQIDDGWQVGRWKKVMSPSEYWSLSTKAYPHGWDLVTKVADEKDIILAFWCDGDDIPEEALLRHVNDAGFQYVKFDFYAISTYDQVEDLRRRARTLLKQSDHTVRINWDVTGTRSKDQGMFYGREYGNLWYQNQKQHLPDHVLYRPYRVLQDVWHISHYVNLNQLQIPIQNVDADYPPETNAGEYNHTYAVAIGLMGCPNFFQEIKYLDKKARQEIGSLLDVYKKVRPDIVEGYVYPIGGKPDDRNWTGFQCHLEKANRGYLLIFREIKNQKSEETIPLHFVKGKTLILTNLRTNQAGTVRVPDTGQVKFRIDEPADILFLSYSVK